MNTALSLLIACSLQQPAPAPTLSQRLAGLQPEVLVTTLTPAEQAAATPLEHDTEVSRQEQVTLVVTIASCEADARGACNASADVVVYGPDGAVHREMKNVSLNSKRGSVAWPVVATDATGLYKVVATVRDLNGRRFGKAERLFGVK